MVMWNLVNLQLSIKKLYELTRNVESTNPPTNEDNCGGLPFMDFFDFEYYQERYAKESIEWYNEYKHQLDDPTLHAIQEDE